MTFPLRLAACGLAAAVAVTVARPAVAQSSVAAQWNFNAGGTATAPAASTNNTAGTPTAALYGGLTADLPAGSGGGSTDPAATNIAWNTTTYPAAGGGSGTAGVSFALSTAGFDNLFVRYDQRASETGTAFHRFEYTLDGGTTWAGGTTYRLGTDGEFTTRSFDLSAVSGAGGNAAFGFRVGAVFAPGGTDYQAAGFLEDQTFAYTPTGAIRYDMVTVSRGVNWVGGGGTNIAAAANWQGGAVPGAAETMVFGASANTAVSVDAAATYGHMVFRGATNYTVSAAAGQQLQLDVGLANLGTAAQTFPAPVTFTRAATVENNGLVVFNGAVSMSGTGNRLQLIGAGTTAFNAGYTGNDITVGAGHTIAGVGTLSNEIQNLGGRIRGGVADGTNNYGTLTVAFTGGATGDIEFYAAPGGLGSALVVEATRTGVGQANNSKIAVTGGGSCDIELNNAGVGDNKLRFEVIANNLVVGERYNLTVITTDSTGSVEFNNNPSADGFVFPAGSYEVTAANYTLTDVQIQVVDVSGASTVVLSFTPVPEPGTVVGAAAGLAVGGWVRRRVRRRIA